MFVILFCTIVLIYEYITCVRYDVVVNIKKRTAKYIQQCPVEMENKCMCSVSCCTNGRVSPAAATPVGFGKTNACALRRVVRIRPWENVYGKQCHSNEMSDLVCFFSFLSVFTVPDWSLLNIPRSTIIDYYGTLWCIYVTINS